MSDIDDYIKKYGNQPSPSPSPTGLQKYYRTPADRARLARQEEARRRAAQTAARPTQTQTQTQAKPFDLWGTIGKGLGDAAQGWGNAAGVVNKGLWDRANTHTKNIGAFWDSVWGKQNTSPVATKGRNEIGSGGSWDKPNVIPDADTGGGESEFDLMSLSDALSQVQSLMGGGAGHVSYDPLRNQARSQWSDADARTAAMYQQLQGAIGAQGDDYRKIYDEGVANTNKATEFANTQNLQAQQGLNDMQSQQAKALGIEEAVANTLNGGDLASRDAADRAADTAARGQITSNHLNSDRTSALDWNTDLVGSAGLQGAMTRDKRLNELNRLLAGYDVDEQAANAQLQTDYEGQSYDRAFDLLGLNRDDFAQWNDNQRFATSEANDRWYDEARINKPSSSSGKPALLSTADAITRALSEYGLKELPVDQTKRNEVLSRARIYEGYSK